MVNKNAARNNAKRSVRNKSNKSNKSNKGPAQAKSQANSSNKTKVTPPSKHKSVPNVNKQENIKNQTVLMTIIKKIEPESEAKMEDITTTSLIEEPKSIDQTQHQTQIQNQVDEPEEFQPVIDVAVETPYTTEMMESEALLAHRVLKKIKKNQKRTNHVSKKGAKIGMSVEEEKMAQLIKKSKKQIGEKSKTKLNQDEKKAIMKHIAHRLTESTNGPTSHLIEITPVLAEAIEENKKNNKQFSKIEKNSKSLFLSDPESHADFIMANNSRLQHAFGNNGEGLDATDVISILPQLMDITKANASTNPMLSSVHLTYEQRVENLTNHIKSVVKVIFDLMKMNENTRKSVEQQFEKWLPSAVKIIIRVEDYIEEHEILKKTMVCLRMCCHKQDDVEIEIQ